MDKIKNNFLILLKYSFLSHNKKQSYLQLARYASMPLLAMNWTFLRQNAKEEPLWPYLSTRGCASSLFTASGA